MNNIAFDTLKLSRKLESAGFTHEQAVGAAEALSEAVTDGVATKGDLRETENRLTGEIKVLKGDLRETETRLAGEIRLVKWMLALVIAATVLPLVKDLL